MLDAILTRLSRDGLSKEVGDLKQQLLASEDALRREKTNFEAEQTCQKVRNFDGLVAH